MKERPILFSGPMVRAILEDRKTQTRRVCKAAIDRGIWANAAHPAQDGMPIFWWHIIGESAPDRAEISKRAYPTGTPCPYGKPGDRLWVRETWHLWGPPEHQILEYRADCAEPEQYTWRPSIFMPRKYSRITLEIVSIDAERVQAISEEDAQAEGVTASQAGDSYPFAMSARMNFVDLWDGINAKRGYGWADDPWVWVVTFKRMI